MVLIRSERFLSGNQNVPLPDGGQTHLLSPWSLLWRSLNSDSRKFRVPLWYALFSAFTGLVTASIQVHRNQELTVMCILVSYFILNTHFVFATTPSILYFLPTFFANVTVCLVNAKGEGLELDGGTTDGNVWPTFRLVLVGFIKKIVTSLFILVWFGLGALVISTRKCWKKSVSQS